jgi:hypothetical protein
MFSSTTRHLSNRSAERKRHIPVHPKSPPSGLQDRATQRSETQLQQQQQPQSASRPDEQSIPEPANPADAPKNAPTSKRMHRRPKECTDASDDLLVRLPSIPPSKTERSQTKQLPEKTAVANGISGNTHRFSDAQPRVSKAAKQHPAGCWRRIAE